MKLAVLAVVHGALRQEGPEEALQPGASLLEEAGAPLLFHRASAFALPGVALPHAGRSAATAMRVPEEMPTSFAFQGKAPASGLDSLGNLEEAQHNEPVDPQRDVLAQTMRGPGLLQGLFGVRSEERKALRLRDELPKEAQETLYGRLVHWALLEATQHNPNFEGKPLLELREEAYELDRIIKFDAVHAGDVARANPLVTSRVRQRMLDFARRLSDPLPGPVSWKPGPNFGALQWADGAAKILVAEAGYYALRGDTVLGPFIEEAETLAKDALSDDENPHGLLRSAAKLGLLLKDGDDGQIAELVTAEALECMRAEYSQSFVEAAIQMYNRFQKDAAKNLGTIRTRGPKQELAATQEDFLTMPNRERRNLVLKGMAAGGLLYGLLPDDMSEFVWNEPSARSYVRNPGPEITGVTSSAKLTPEQELAAMMDSAMKAGLYK